SDILSVDHLHTHRRQSRSSRLDWKSSAPAVVAASSQPAFAAACVVPAVVLSAKADTPGRCSFDGRHVRGISECDGSRSADTAELTLPSAQHPARPPQPYGCDSSTPSAQLAAACRLVVPRDLALARTQRHLDEPTRLPFFAAISFITSISRSRSATSFFS